MNEQLIAQLQLLIELAKTGEEFESEYSSKFLKNRFNNNCLQRCHKEGADWDMSGVWFNDLISETIIRRPWKPKVKEGYWAWHLNLQADICVYFERHDGFHADYLNFSIGNCFRTKEECESHTEIRDKLIAMRKEYE